MQFVADESWKDFLGLFYSQNSWSINYPGYDKKDTKKNNEIIIFWNTGKTLLRVTISILSKCIPVNKRTKIIHDIY